MRFNLFQLSAVFLAGMALQSCGVDEITVPADELYARDFIKTFGVVDPDHDWTAATHTGVTVTTASPSRVKIIATHNGKRYLFADYTDVNGTRTLPFDLPKGVTDITVRVNGKDYPATPGSTVNATAASRALNEGTFEGVRTVTISELTEEPTYLTLTKDEMVNVIEHYLKENDREISNITESNLGKVTDNFYAKSKSFYIFPEYWDTSEYNNNKIGVYYYVPEGTEGAEPVTYRTPNADGGYDETTRYVVRVKIFDGLIDQLKRGTVDNNWTDKWFDLWNVKDIPDDWTEKIYNAAVEAKLDDIFCKADGTTHADKNGNLFTEGAYLYKCSDGSYIDYQHSLALLKSDDKETKTLAAEMYGAIASMFPNELFLLGYRWENTFTDISSINYNFGVNKLTMADGNPGKAVKDEFSNYDIYHSYGVKIEFDQVTEFGFWIEQGAFVMYSESALNEPFTTKNENGEDQTYMSSYVATLKAGHDSYGNDKRYLCFEDWHISAGANFDMNDMVFRVYGFDHLREELPDNPGGEIVPDPDPTPDPDPDPEVFQWIVACEDLGGSFDYDFNDVVFGVQYVAGDTHPYVYVTALAAGGTLPVELIFNGKPVTGKGEGQEIVDGTIGDDGEWHSWFGSSDLKPINVSGSFSVGATVRLSHDGNFTMGIESGDLSGFMVRVKTDEGDVTVKRPHQNGGVADKIPQMFVTTGSFTWPCETTPIYSTHTGDNGKGEYNKEIEHQGKKYTGYHNSFLHWIENADCDFHNQPATGEGSVVNHEWPKIAIRIVDYIGK